MYRIMFVCHGNICRSPMAEFIFKDLLNKSGYADRFYVSSSATSTEEIYDGIGNPVYPKARKELEKHGVFCGNRRAVQLKKGDYGNYDIFVGMDSANIVNMYKIFGGDPDKKIHKLMSFTNSSADVADPWYSDRFDRAFEDIYKGCRALLNHLQMGEQ